MKRLIGIAGGIGSGKSIVSRVLRSMGYDVYDCDLEARNIMNQSARIKCAIRDRISADVTDGEIAPDRKLLADIVFNNETARKTLNEIVHGAVREHLSAHHKEGVLWVEAAILAESGLADMCDCIWVVEAPIATRVKRVVERDSISPHLAMKRICAQMEEEKLLERYSAKITKIINDDSHSVLEQVERELGYSPLNFVSGHNQERGKR